MSGHRLTTYITYMKSHEKYCSEELWIVMAFLSSNQYNPMTHEEPCLKNGLATEMWPALARPEAIEGQQRTTSSGHNARLVSNCPILMRFLESVVA
ncbi:hypothetical protein Pan97_27600 [Bremerella volcania]|uniref:Uncharacterized protein n=1 Tax=Bremerella volcania TaxID=2527984 RepID=A0A518C916_9BACT|nr:hypothetical protein Pan97_27600 [Bremerella volcania]